LNKEMLKDTSGRTKRDLHPDEEGFIGAWKWIFCAPSIPN
jgi:hypothetical protein